MSIEYYVVDAFTDEVFRGNPAGVCILDRAIPAEMMQKIAYENNLAETAFLLKNEAGYSLRWFTPEVEIDLCGHATLATAYIMMNFIQKEMTKIVFSTMSGELTVTRDGELLKMDFPNRMPKPIEANPAFEEALGCRILESYLSRDLMLVAEDEKTVRNLQVDLNKLKSISSDIAFAIIVTAPGEECDFVSRFFAPNAGINEDPVTGSSHSTLIPFWSKRLNKDRMIAKQLSPRGGTLYCRALGDRVEIGGKAVCYMKGELELMC